MRIVVVLDCADPDRLAGFWSAALGYRRQGPEGAAEPYVSLVPPARDGPELLLQRVPEPKVGKNRMHVDLRVDVLEPAVERLLRLGARQLSTRVLEEDGFRWVTMADPAGNEFCVCVEPD